MSVIISIFQLKSESSWRDWDSRSAALEKKMNIYLYLTQKLPLLWRSESIHVKITGFFLLENGTLNRRYLGILSFHFCLNIRSVGRNKEFFVLQAF